MVLYAIIFLLSFSAPVIGATFASVGYAVRAGSFHGIVVSDVVLTAGVLASAIAPCNVS